MNTETKKQLRQVRIYLQTKDDDILRRITGQAPTLSESDVVSLLVEAGLRAYREAGYLPIPLHFEIVNQYAPAALNDAAKPRK